MRAAAKQKEKKIGSLGHARVPKVCAYQSAAGRAADNFDRNEPIATRVEGEIWQFGRRHRGRAAVKAPNGALNGISYFPVDPVGPSVQLV